jgi:hypothetical protein
MQHLAKSLLTWVLSSPFWKLGLRFCRKRRDTHPKIRRITDTSSNRKHTSLVRTHHLVIQPVFLSPKLLRHPPASFAQAVNEGECREATLSRLLL